MFERFLGGEPGPMTGRSSSPSLSSCGRLLNPHRMIGFAWAALKEAYYSENSDMLLLVDYDLLASRPGEVMPLIYGFLGEEPFDHAFDNVEYEAEDFDSQFVAKGVHTAGGKIELKPRQTILLPDLFKRCQDLLF